MTAQGRNGHLTITYYDTNKKRINSRFLLRFTTDGGEVSAELSPPAGCVAANVTGYGTVLESFKVIEQDTATDKK